MGLGEVAQPQDILQFIPSFMFASNIFPALKLTENFYLHYNIRTFSWKVAVSWQIASLSPTPHAVLKDYPHHLKKYESKGTSFKSANFKTLKWIGKNLEVLFNPGKLGYSKIPIFHLFHEFGKTWKCTKIKTNNSESKF